eukprot:CAMPEP_0184447668 /NCGR_PEP_ID=MMETSP0740-20130409/3846_1 /TAXON_ID=385413 /ORGANISM="Thalassiosira miniscula, Strain CCMP1093" /LENGTH=33 /DNA_ID= /DNA_START= /DNA_END= /DNA_ORIENTATION=
MRLYPIVLVVLDADLINKWFGPLPLQTSQPADD